MHKDLKNVLLSEEDIQNICKEMGAIITEDYKDRPRLYWYFEGISHVYGRLN